MDRFTELPFGSKMDAYFIKVGIIAIRLNFLIIN